MRNNMANVYESDDFNITEVHLANTLADLSDYEDNPYRFWFCKVQRLPESQYPLITEVYIMENELSASSTEAEFLANAPSIIASKLTEFDAAPAPDNYSSTADTAVSLSTQKFA